MDERTLIWAEGRDGSLSSEFLRKIGKEADACVSAGDLVEELNRGAGVLIVAAELFRGDAAGTVRNWIASQAAWSDLPVLVIAGRGEMEPAFNEMLKGLGSFSVLHRPLSLDTLYSTVEAALRARRRQYQVRDLLVQRDETDRRREEFLAMLAHELRNPLAPMRTGLQVIRLSESPELTARTHKMLERQLGNLTRLIDDLLDVSRITRGKISLRRQIIDLHETVAGVVSARQLQAAEKGLHVELLPPQPPSAIYVNADPVRLEQVIDNVLTNAIKFTPQNGRVEVTVTGVDDSALIRVRDTGVGIPENMLSGIFDLFAQTDRPLDRSQGGLGIGLTVVRSLVELHGGSVSAASPGESKGTTIEIYLPSVVIHSSVLGTAEQNEIRTSAPSRKVLLVEDNRDTAEMLATYLRACGHQVRAAYDGQTGLEIAFTTLPDVMICDIGLPGMNGLELARRVRESAELSHVLLIAVTGYGEPRDRERGSEAGFDHYLVKPADPQALARLLSVTPPERWSHD